MYLGFLKRIKRLRARHTSKHQSMGPTKIKRTISWTLMRVDFCGGLLFAFGEAEFDAFAALQCSGRHCKILNVKVSFRPRELENSLQPIRLPGDVCTN